MDNRINNIELNGDKDEDRNLIPETTYIRFKHPAINDRLAKFSKAKKWLENPLASKGTFPENIIQKFSSLNTTQKIAELYTANGVIPVYKIRYKDTDIAFYLSRVGALACVVGFEEIVAMGAKKFVLFGSCGVLDDDSVKDQLIIPVSAVRDEGTSYHYIAPSPEIEADPHSVKILENVLSNCGYPYIKGKTWTSDAIYRYNV